MKNTLVLYMVLVANSFFAQEIDISNLKKDLNVIIEDATTGFQKSKAGFDKKSWDGKFYTSFNSIFKSDNSRIIYREEKYMKYTGDLPEVYYYEQYFSGDSAEGILVYENLEQILNELAVSMNLKVVDEKLEKKDRKTNRNIMYLDKNKRLVFKIYKNLEKKSTYINIHSDLRPVDLPKYQGCLIVYNFQAGKVVGVSLNYVYGPNLPNAEKLYYIVKPKIENQYTNYDKYEFTGRKQRQLEDFLAPFGDIQKIERNITPEGNNFIDN